MSYDHSRAKEDARNEFVRRDANHLCETCSSPCDEITGLCKADMSHMVRVDFEQQIEEVEATFTVRIAIKAARFDSSGRDRGDLVAALQSAMTDALYEDMPYQPDSREDTDLVQEVLEVEILVGDHA